MTPLQRKRTRHASLDSRRCFSGCKANSSQIPSQHWRGTTLCPADATKGASVNNIKLKDKSGEGELPGEPISLWLATTPETNFSPLAGDFSVVVAGSSGGVFVSTS